MSTELLDWIYAYLENDEEIVVPINKMWNAWHRIHAEPSLEAFTALALADERVEPMRGVNHNEELEFERDMEARGYFSGPRVKLRSREITREHIMAMLKKHNDRMEDSLKQAMAAMPDDATVEAEDMLTRAMRLARKLRRGLRAAGLEADDENDR